MPTNSTPRELTNLTINALLLQKARAFGANLSQATKAGLRRAVVTASEEAEKRENVDALSSSNPWIDENNVALDQFRQF